jgi:hypothetical protein
MISREAHEPAVGELLGQGEVLFPGVSLMFEFDS